jgi:hypothetical protein
MIIGMTHQPLTQSWARKLTAPFRLPIISSLFAIDFRSLAFFRICLGYMVICDLLVILPNLKQFYTDSGVLPRSLLLQLFGQGIGISINLMSGDLWFQVLLCLTGLAAAAALMIGYRTRTATIICWYLLISLSWRNPKNLQGGDQLLWMLLFWSMFLPLGEIFSADQLRRKKKMGPKLALGPASHLSLASFAILLQICIVYFVAGYTKTSDGWIFGDALHHALSLDHFVTPIGKLALKYPRFLEWMTHGTLILEYGGALLLLCPFKPHIVRLIGIMSFVSLHLGIASMMNIGLFPYIDIMSLMLFIPGRAWDIVGVSSATSSRTSSEESSDNCGTSGRSGRGGWAVISNIMCALALILVLWWVAKVNHKGISMPKPLETVARSMRLAQNWNMFCKVSPATLDGWVVIVGGLSDGSWIDLFRNGKKVSWDKPRMISSEFKDYRELHYLMHIMPRNQTNKALVSRYCLYLRGIWNEKLKSQNLKVKIIKFYFMEETSTGYYDSNVKIKPRLLYTLKS